MNVGGSRLVALVALVALVMGCASPVAPPASPEVAVLGKGARVLVVTFFSPTCPCQTAHDARLRALAEGYAARGVRFVAVDAEVDATPARAREEAARRGYSFPILADPEGKLADRLGADVATYSVVFDGAGRARYRGGIDSDWTHATSGAEPWLRDAIEAVLRDEEPRPSEHRALGCAIRRR